MKYNYIILLSILILISACGPSKLIVNVENINDVKTTKNNNIIYALPKTSLKIKVKAINNIYVKGPFADYAQKYLGIEDYINENTNLWSIESVDIQSYPVIDTSQIYVIESNYNINSFLVNLTPEGLLAGINSDYEVCLDNSSSVNNQIVSDKNFKLSYANVNFKNNFETIYDTIKQRLGADSTFLNIPTVKKQLIRRTPDEQAQELAEQILLLRDDRNALLVGEGDNQNLPTGDALKLMIDGLNKLEEKYLAMFVGKKFALEYNYEFDYIPENKPNMQSILFRFTPELGILPKNSIKGNPVIIDISNNLDAKSIITYHENQDIIYRMEKEKKPDNGLVYRIGSKADIKLFKGNDVLLSSNLYIAQFGTLMYLPLSLLYDNAYKIEFYPQYGTLKSIKKE